LGRLRSDDTPQADGPAVGHRKGDIGTMDLGQLVEHFPRAATEARPATPSFESLLQSIGQKADQNVGLDATRQSVPEDAQPQLIFYCPLC